MIGKETPLFLVGYMGAGKSTVGRKLATLLQRTFIDTDFFIENRFRKRVADIFETEGEAVFRQREHIAIEELLGYHNVVIATGGGLPCFSDHMALMNQVGVTIYLRHTTEALAQRLQFCKRTRPAISQLEGPVLEQYVAEGLDMREPYYSQARLVVDYAIVSPNGNEHRIAEYLKSLLEDPLFTVEKHSG